MIEYIDYFGWTVVIIALALFSYVQYRNESKIPLDYEGLICGRCRKPCSENELSSFEGIHIHFLKLFRIPREELDQLYCFGCKKKLQRIGYFVLLLIGSISLFFIVLVAVSKFG